MILAAGMGTRLKPLTDTMPKALVPVGGKPLLHILIDRLKAAGIHEVVINVHHFAQQIIDYCDAHDNFGIDIRISDETRCLLETGGAIKHAAPLLSQAGDDSLILVHNVDILNNARLQELVAAAPHDAEACLLVSERNTSRYLLFDDDNRLCGWTNVDTGEVKSPYEHLDAANCRKYAFSGIHLFSPRLFPCFESWPDKFSIIDFYLSMCREHPIYGLFQPQLQLLDVGKQNTLHAADEFLAQINCESRE